MTEYIDKSRALREWPVCDEPADAYQFIRDYPAADVVEVRHGRWIRDCERKMGDGWTYTQRHCSVCGGQTVECVNYCQFCGAKMDGGADNDD